MNRIKVRAFPPIAMLIMLGVFAPTVLGQEPAGIIVSLNNEPWSKWIIPTNPITLSNTGTGISQGSINGVSFGSNNADGFYLVAFMGSEGHLAKEDGEQLANPLQIKFPGMATEEPMIEGSIDGYPSSLNGYMFHEYSAGSYAGNIGLLQEISDSDPKGTYSGTISIALTYAMG